MFVRIQNFFRLLYFLYIQRIKGLTPPGEEPYMPDAEVARFKDEISKASLYVEFGSGGSTVYASRLGIETISVENDPYYARVVAKRLMNGAVRQIIVQMGITGEWGIPVYPNARKAHEYVTAPWNDKSFPQFILVDGRYRVACALESARRAYLFGCTATLMFDDYVDRVYYHEIEKLLGKPEIIGRAAIFAIGKEKVLEADVERWLLDSG